MSESDGAVIEATPDEMHAWDKEEGYFSIARPTTPPNSVHDEEISIFAALEDKHIMPRAVEDVGALAETMDVNKPAAQDMEPKLVRRHTFVSPPRQFKPSRTWRSVKRTKTKTSSDALRLVR